MRADGLSPTVSLNVAQNLFVVFFAIFWGTISNSWPRWKPFHWTLFGADKKVRLRVLFSNLLLNLAPLVYVAGVLWLLSIHDTMPPGADLLDYCKEAISGIFPAFAIFGLYRIWFAYVGKYPSKFYHKELVDTDGKTSATDQILPSIPDAIRRFHGLEPNYNTKFFENYPLFWRADLYAGLLYIFGPLATALLVRYWHFWHICGS